MMYFGRPFGFRKFIIRHGLFYILLPIWLLRQNRWAEKADIISQSMSEVCVEQPLASPGSVKDYLNVKVFRLIKAHFLEDKIQF